MNIIGFGTLFRLTVKQIVTEGKKTTKACLKTILK